MAHLFRFIFIFCSVISFAVSCSLPQTQGIVKVARPFHDVPSLCADKSIVYARSRKLICLICKGFDPTCFGITSTTTTSTTSTTTSTTTPASTTTSSTTTPSTTSTTTTVPTTTTTTTSTE